MTFFVRTYAISTRDCVTIEENRFVEGVIRKQDEKYKTNEENKGTKF